VVCAGIHGPALFAAVFFCIVIIALILCGYAGFVNPTKEAADVYCAVSQRICLSVHPVKRKNVSRQVLSEVNK